MAENIIIEFTADTAGLEPAVDQLERLGTIDKQAAAAFKATNAELAKKSQVINKNAQAAQQENQKTKATIADVTKSIQNLTETLVTEFASLKEVLTSLAAEGKKFGDDTEGGTNKAGKAADSLKGKLRQLTQQLALMKLEGKDNTKEYKRLAQEAGNLQDAIADANQEVKNFGSDTGNIDGLISAAQGVAGAFAIGQGAIGLFGEEGEELQETLLKVNSAMAILQGLQQVQTVLQKESAAATFLQTAGQKIYNVVIGESIGLMAAFRIALAATGVGLLILGIAALVQILEQQEKQLERVNAALDANKNAIDSDRKAIEDLAEAEIARAEAAGSLESDIIRIRGRSLLQQRGSIVEQNKILVQQRDALDKTSEGYFKLNAAIESNNDLIKGIDQNLQLEGINLAKQRREEELRSIADIAAARLASTVKNSKAELDAAKAAARAKAAVDINAAGQNAAEILRIQSELNDQLRDLDRQFAVVRQQDRIAAIEAALIAEQQISQAINARQSQVEIDLQKRLIQQQANLELLQEGLTQNQILQIKKEAQSKILRLQKDFNKQASEEALQDFISANNAQLAAIDLTNKERLDLTIDNIIAQAEIEVQQNEGLSQKIKEINAKRDADIKAARLASIQQLADQEIEVQTIVQAATVRQQEKELAAQDEIRQAQTEAEIRSIEERLGIRRLTLAQEFQLIDDLANKDLESINIRLKALNDSFEQGLISFRQYNTEYNKLTDEQAKVVENAEQRKRDAEKKTEDERKERNKRIVSFSIDAARQNLEFLTELFQQQADREQAHIEGQRKLIDEQRKAGQITEKEEQRRIKQLDAEQRKLQTQQAKRQKAIALFNAVISVAQAVATAYTAGPVIGPILAGITAALGAAQIALIAARPIPQFKKGKKDSYQGPGVVGEAGAELIEKDGQLYVAPKKTIVWLGSKDKVFNPQETIAMLEKPGLRTQKIDRLEAKEKSANLSIDYEKLGKAVGKNIPQFGLNVDAEGFSEWVQGSQSFTKYINARRGFK
jgi:hypothetical protein